MPLLRSPPFLFPRALARASQRTLQTTNLVPDLVKLITALVDALDDALYLLLELAGRGHGCLIGVDDDDRRREREIPLFSLPAFLPAPCSLQERAKAEEERGFFYERTHARCSLAQLECERGREAAEPREGERGRERISGGVERRREKIQLDLSIAPLHFLLVLEEEEEEEEEEKSKKSKTPALS